MSWRDRLQRGSFRGVPFYLETNSYSGGRRQIEHAFPNKEQGFIEDNGRRDGRHQMQLYVVGDNYDIARDALEQALESDQGAGTLIHPRRGAIQVVVGEFSITESTAEQGMARFDVLFLEAKKRPQPTSEIDSQAIVASAADQTLESIKAGFVSTYKTDGFPQFVAESSQNQLQNLVSDLRGINSRLNAAQQPISDFFRDIDSLGNELGSLIRQPANLVNRVVGGIAAIAGVINDVNASIAVYENLARVVPPNVSAFDTPSRQQEQANAQAINRMQAQAAAVEAARASSALSYDSYQQATAIRDRVVALLDEQLLTADDDTYTTMRDLRAKVVQDIRARGADLSRIENYTPTQTAPALVVAYRLYGDAEREQEIIKRNNIKNPAFVQGGQALEVLSV